MEIPQNTAANYVFFSFMERRVSSAALPSLVAAHCGSAGSGNATTLFHSSKKAEFGCLEILLASENTYGYGLESSAAPPFALIKINCILKLELGGYKRHICKAAHCRLAT
ncbi:hypothetical protein CRENBAI_015450 [Crenichthys baileyi]|uniref:Uncharacterized protein n=1 Tax=Crenichthys baileyi TaxID=28760 RepID=A0AAV9RXN3_9TELE